MRADCGGKGTCGRCQVRFLSEPPPLGRLEQPWFTSAETQDGWRLACRSASLGKVNLEYNPAWELQFQLEPLGPIAGRQLALAVDIGTTGLVAALVDQQSGDPLLLARGFNPQRAWGADVMTRLVAARSPASLKQLQAAILKAIETAVRLLLRQAKKTAPATVLAVGNTTMIHLAAGIPETTLSVYPFRSPLENQPAIRVAMESFELHLAGPLQGYVGSDLLAVLNCLQAHGQNSAPQLIIDLGTNSEIALWEGKKYWVTACAAGPAFEGGGLSCGSPAGPGVAEDVRFSDGRYQLLPDDSQPKFGLCGSALIALLAELVRQGHLRRDGKLMDGKSIQLQNNHKLTLSQKDVRSLQLAKGAIHAGIVALLRRSGLARRKLERTIITGAFARNLKAADLQEIGLVPEGRAQIQFINDGALQGAALALAQSGEPLSDIRPLVEVINLVEEEEFQEDFLTGLELKLFAKD